jgi:death on curing protein
VIYLTPEQILFLHARLIQETGGAHGVRELGLLLSAAARPQSTFDEQDLYPDLSTKAGALFQSLIGNHPFIDGNKRTAISAAGIFLRLNGARLVTSQAELESFTLRAAQGQVSFEDIVAWFIRYTLIP